MSWTIVAEVSTGWTISASVSDYVLDDYVIDDYVDGNIYSTIAAAANTWSAA